MLIGSLTYRDKDLGEFKYDVLGMDTLDCLKLHITNNSSDYTGYTDGTRLFDKHVDDETGEVTYPYDDVSGVSDGRGLFIKETSKFKTTITNKEFCSRISALVRYIKTHKNANSNIVLQEGDSFSKTRIVEVEHAGTIGYSLGLVTDLDIHNKYFDLTLSTFDDKTIDLSVFKDLKDADKYGNILSVTPVSQIGFKMCEDLLGFPYVPAVRKLDANIFGLYATIEEVIANNTDKNTAWILERDYKIVDDSMLDDVIKEFEDYDGYIAFDTETSGLEINFKSRVGEGKQLVGVVLSKKEGTGYYFPLQHKLFDNLCGGDHWYFMEKYMKHILETKKIIVHNAKFDWKVAYIYGIDTNIVYDTLLALGVTKRYEQESIQLGLKALAKNILGLDMFGLDDFVKGSSFSDSNIAFWDLPYELVRRYAPADADMTLSLFNVFNKERLLQRYDAEKIFKIEIDFAICVAYSEFYGYRIDVDNVPDLKSNILGNMEKYKKQLFEMAGKEFNPNSPKQLSTIMYDELGVPQLGSKRSTDKDTLKALKGYENADGTPKYPFVVALKNYRDNEGIHKNFLKKLHEFATHDGYIFPDVMQLGTITGRSSVKNPNYQSYNDPVKKNVVPRPDYIHVDSDFSQIEYRVLASMAGQESLIKAFDDPDLDYHSYQASRMFGIPYELVTKELRQQSKGVNFGLPYGMGDSSLGSRVFGERTKENTSKAAELRRKFFVGQEKIQQFFDRVRSEGVANGYTVTLFGRRRYYHRGVFTIAEIRRQAGNHVIQGCLGGDTRIQTKEFGIVKIKDVVGNHLNVWDGERWSDGDITYSGKKKKCIVRFSGGMSMICSPIHKFMTVSSKGNRSFVECKDLRSTSICKNAHRVAINSSYEPSDFTYSSEDAYKYRGVSQNANNVFIEDLKDSFGQGVILGRLASDGTYNTREDGGSYATHFVAEHEYSILPKLKTYMEGIGCTESEKDLRVGRTQKMTQLTTYSKSLVSEIKDLDIKHKVHGNIFMDTEVLRGFLSGFFDGDGGVSGKTITLVFGKQFNFEPMCLDLQKALLFFGIRSRYRCYDDRYVIQVKTNDNPRFLDVIGFVNDSKQAKARELKCSCDEHTFGKTLIVESVEITDESIDMYDVCNTDRGYYVADGVITHNTAADIYKLAVNEMFAEVRKKGWLGLVLFNVFVHDELLMEVHKSIDMYEFLKSWKNRFQVKIENFCTLYAGVGIGRNWYTAKKQDLPPQYSDILVAKADEPHEWNGDFDAFLEDVNKGFIEYKIKRVRDFITDADNKGKIIKPAVYSLLMDCLGMILARAKSDASLVDMYNDIIGVDVFSIKEDGSLDGDIKDLQLILKLYCHFYDVDYSCVDIKSFSDGTTVTNTIDEEEKSFSLDDVEDECLTEVFVENALKDGIGVDYNTSTMYIRQMMCNGQTIFDDIVRGGMISQAGCWNIVLIKDSKDALNSGFLLDFHTDNDSLAAIKGLYAKYTYGGGVQVDLV